MTADWRGENGQEETLHDDFACCRITWQDTHEQVAPLLYVYKTREQLPTTAPIDNAGRSKDTDIRVLAPPFELRSAQPGMFAPARGYQLASGCTSVEAAWRLA